MPGACPPPVQLRSACVILHERGATPFHVHRHSMFSNAAHDIDMDLLKLPGELLSAVVASIDDVTTLRQVAAVCRLLNDLTEPFLYQSLIISDGSQAAMLAETIAKRPSRASHIRNLLASTRFEKAQGIEQLPGVLAVMQNLRELNLETPDCNLKDPGERIPWIRLQERYERVFQHSSLLLPPQARSLPRLRSCTLIYLIGSHPLSNCPYNGNIY